MRKPVSSPRVLQVCQPADGGVAHHVLSLSSELRAAGWSVDVACSPGELADKLRARGFCVQTLPLVREVSPRRDLAAALRLYAMIRKGGYSVVHTHSAKGGVLGRAAAWLARTPVLYTPHAWSFLVSNSLPERRFYTAVEQVLTFITSRVICVSTEELELGQHRLRGSKKKLRLVPNGVDLPPEPRPRAGSGELVVGTVARLTRQKGVEYLIEAASRICAGRDGVRFSVAGYGPDLENLRRRLETREELRGCFEFVGRVDEPWEHLRKLDVFVLPSLWEGMPYTLLEAMGAGLPVVATDVGGVRDLIPTDTFGAVVPPADPGALEKAILRYADSPRLRRDSGRAAQERVLREFTRQRTVELTTDIYSEVTNVAKVSKARS